MGAYTQTAEFFMNPESVPLNVPTEPAVNAVSWWPPSNGTREAAQQKSSRIARTLYA
jgi:hypothetical protein